MTNNDEQLTMNFDDSNSFKEALCGGKFSIIIEMAVPAEDQGDRDTLFTLEKMAEECSRHEEVVGLAISDRIYGPTCMPSWKLAEKLSRIASKPAIAHISGHKHSIDSLEQEIASSISAGINNLLIVSGNLNDGSDSYVESTDALRSCTEKWPNILCGAGINPFKYSVNSSFSQYLKMVQKINSGAGFITTQAGLDMRKYDEVLRYCTHREITTPLIARLDLISHDRLGDITELQLETGVHLSREIASLILREAEEAEDQSNFMSQQLRRLCLQVNACALMGYNGVQVKGLKNAVELNQFLQRLRSCMEEITTLDQFYEEWEHVNKSVTFTPSSSVDTEAKPTSSEKGRGSRAGNYYIYKTNHNRPVDCIQEKLVEDDLIKADFTYPSDFELFRTKLAKKLHLDAKDGNFASILKSLTGCGEPERADLKKVQFTDLSACPKQLIHGCCGGSDIHDRCENSEIHCVHLDRLGMAASLNQLDLLEHPSDRG